MASAQSAQRQPAAFERAMMFDGLYGVVGTAWMEAALVAYKGAQGQLVEPDEGADRVGRKPDQYRPETMQVCSCAVCVRSIA